MDLSLHTLQARAEVAAMEYDHIRDGRLIVTRAMTAHRTDKAFLSIGITPPLAAVIAQCKADGVLSRFLVHQPAGARKTLIGRGLKPETLSRGFQKAREAAQAEHPQLFVREDGEPLAAEELPTFHEIRALGGDLYRKAGWPEEEIQKLYAHTTRKMTDKYLEGHEPERVRVKAGLDITEKP